MIEPEVAALFEGPSSLDRRHRGRGRAARGRCGRGASKVVADDRSCASCWRPTRTATLANLAGDGAIAVTATDVADERRRSRSRAGRAPTEPESDADLARHEHYMAGFFRVIHESDGTPLRAACERLSRRVRWSRS